MQILRYVDGQQYRPHWDYLNDKLHTDPARGGQRFVTVLMYLTTVDEGGETVFPRAEVGVTGPEWSECARQGNAVKARRGDAVMFFAMNPDGSEDPASLHGSCPTTQGTKWCALVAAACCAYSEMHERVSAAALVVRGLGFAAWCKCVCRHSHSCVCRSATKWVHVAPYKH